jgi:N-acetyl-1-D-myo-inositol-2-amino-2-deoxy-alpha-D-glucopyranoside deacetylase
MVSPPGSAQTVIRLHNVNQSPSRALPVQAAGRVDLLIVAPHPDDESVTAGALLAREAARGVRTAVVTCTHGEEGEIVSADIPGVGVGRAAIRPYLGQVRLAELRKACGVLGVAHLRTLGYRDSGMCGTMSTLRPEAFCNADMDEATGRLVRIIRELRPAVVVTESAWGTYGHPDHIMARRVALRAFAAAASETAFPTAGRPWQPARLYAIHPTADRWGVNQRWGDLVRQMREESQGAPYLSRWSLDLVGDEPITTQIDVSAFVGVQRAAIACHRTQFPADSWWLTMPLNARRVALGRSRLARLYPLHTTDEQKHDLFPAGLISPLADRANPKSA